jgi:thiol-disulfide isomerase/thioredoxin
LAQGKLLPIEKGKDVLSATPIKVLKVLFFSYLLQAGDLFEKGPVLLAVIRRPGCMFCRREASQLSALKDKLDAKNVRLVGVVHETLGVEEFKPYLGGDVYFDQEVPKTLSFINYNVFQKHFYGPTQRWLPLWMGFLRFSTYINMVKTKQQKFEGNTAGEGRLLGGVYLIKGNEMVFAHLEKDWGDAVDPKKVEGKR